MDERALKYFASVAALGSIRAAAKQLYVSPSSITRKIQILEANLAVTLVDRAGSKLRLTNEGKVLLQFIERRHQQEISFYAELDNLISGQTGPVRLAIGGGFVGNFIASALARFTRVYPGVGVHLTVTNGNTIIDKVKNGDADIGMVYELAPDADIEIVKASPRPLRAIVPTTHSLARLTEVSFADLATYSLALLSRDFHVRQLVEAMELSENIILSPVLECDSFDVLDEVLRHCNFPTILPEFCLARDAEKPHWTSLKITGRTAVKPMAYLIRSGKRTTPKSATLLMDFIRQYMETFAD